MAVIDLGEDNGCAIILGQKPPGSSKKPSTPKSEQPQDQQPSPGGKPAK